MIKAAPREQAINVTVAMDVSTRLDIIPRSPDRIVRVSVSYNNDDGIERFTKVVARPTQPAVNRKEPSV